MEIEIAAGSTPPSSEKFAEFAKGKSTSPQRPAVGVLGSSVLQAAFAAGCSWSTERLELLGEDVKQLGSCGLVEGSAAACPLLWWKWAGPEQMIADSGDTQYWPEKGRAEETHFKIKHFTEKKEKLARDKICIQHDVIPHESK